MIEIWKDIHNYEGKYQVSNFGRIKSLNYHRTGKEKILRPEKNTAGYLQVLLYKDRKRHMFRVHRIVWEAFNGPIPEGMEVNHVNECTWDNSLENLNLLTHKENNNWGTRNKRAGNGIAKSRRKMVNQYTLDGEHIMTWFSAKDVEEEIGHLGYYQTAICACCQGKRKKHKGYIWKYKE